MVALGANSASSFGRNARLVAHAIRALPGRVVATSRLYRTPAWPPGNGPDFANAVLMLHCGLPPKILLERLHRIEARAGRVRARRWEPRVLDLDLLACGATVFPDCMTLRQWMELEATRQTVEAPNRLILPHPRLSDRAFVLIPAMDVAPDWRHPATGRTIRTMVAGLSAQRRREIRAIGPVDGVVNRKRGA